MAISKRLRYEVLRRDNYTCRYCGVTADVASIEVDAVLPEALGGSHKDPANLVAACEACNNGKGSSHPAAPLVADVPGCALRWGRAIKAVEQQWLSDMQARDDYREQARRLWEDRPAGTGHFCKPVKNDREWLAVIDQCMAAGLPFQVLQEWTDAATDIWLPVPSRERVGYFCQLARKELGKLYRVAYAVVTAEDPGGT